MDHAVLQKIVRTLVELEETEAPFVSAYLDLTNRSDLVPNLRERSRQIESTLPMAQIHDFRRAVARLEDFVLDFAQPRTQGLAAFVREGEEPFFRTAEFEVPLPTEISVDTVPSVFRLMELKDNYDRFVVLISNEREARILEVSLGAVTRQLWTERPELRKRVGREWTKRHYQNHRRNRTDQFVKEKIDIVDRVMRKGGHSHLILAGHAAMTAQIQRALPKHLRDRLLDLVTADSRASTRDVVAATVAAFVEEEERQSQSVVSLVEREIRSGRGLAVSGPSAVEEALRNGQADLVAISTNYEPPTAGDADRDLLARLAEQHGCQLESVADPTALERLGGVACLLRYRTAEEPQLAPIAP